MLNFTIKNQKPNFILQNCIVKNVIQSAALCYNTLKNVVVMQCNT